MAAWRHRTRPGWRQPAAAAMRVSAAASTRSAEPNRRAAHFATSRTRARRRHRERCTAVRLGAFEQASQPLLVHEEETLQQRVALLNQEFQDFAQREIPWIGQRRVSWPWQRPSRAFDGFPQQERLHLPAELSGATGSNRAPDQATRMAAADDLAAVTAWRARYADSAATLTAYQREVERLILWPVLQLGKPVVAIQRRPTANACTLPLAVHGALSGRPTCGGKSWTPPWAPLLPA